MTWQRTSGAVSGRREASTAEVFRTIHQLQLEEVLKLILENFPLPEKRGRQVRSGS